MDKMKCETGDGVVRNVDKIAAMFPQVVTEVRGEDGKIRRAVKWDVLKELLSGEYVEGGECYDFTWPGKRAAIAEAARPIRKTLRPCKAESKDWDTTQNLYIEGDNLEVLKLLQESYLGKVKMIYIDPPYNTGNDFVYRDDFKVGSDQWAVDSGELFEDEETGEKTRMFRNTEANGRFHSDWCSMMCSRLMVARDFLSEDGVVFISIDDSEVENLRRLCDEIFGANNFIATIVRNTNSSKNQSLFVSVSHEYCLIYAKSIYLLQQKHAENKWAVPKNNVAEYVAKVKQLEKEGLSENEITEELKTLTKYPRFIDFTNYWYFDAKGLYMKDNLGGVANGNKNPIYNPRTGKMDPIPPGGFRYNTATLKKLIDEDRIHFHEDGSLPRLKRYLRDNLLQRPKSIMSDDQRPDYSLMQEFNTPFDNPKQLSFMQRILSVGDSNSIVLDFFSGSATTAHAIMQLNAEDGGKRKFIMVQIPEECPPDSEAAKAGYKNICEIGKERIRRAGEKIKEEAGLAAADLDVGFRVFKVADSNMKDVYYSADDYKQKTLDELISNIKEDRTDLDLLYGCLLEWGVELSLPHTSEKIDGVTVHTVNNGDLIACFDPNIPESAIRAIAKRQPLRAVFRDSSFAGAPQKINVEEIFKLLSPATTVKVI